MTKVPRSRAPAAHPSATLDRSRAVSRKKKPYKIVLEAVTQEKRKVHTIVRRIAESHNHYRILTPHSYPTMIKPHLGSDIYPLDTQK
jgi:hypothetical protein